MKYALFRVSTGLCCGLMLGAQTQPPLVYGAIGGVVVDGGSKTPIGRAIVTLSTVEARPQDAVAWTDDNGRFLFAYLPMGRYQLRVVKNGYQAVAYGAENPRRPPEIIQLATGEFRNNLVLPLQKPITISGLVLDEDGDPVPNVQIMALRSGWQRQKRRLLPGPGTNTDSSGGYRLNGLPQGSYILAAIVSGGQSAVRVQPEATAGQPPQSYSFGTQYYPGTDRAESATLLAVEAGHEYSQIDFRLTVGSTASVQGKIVPPPGAVSVEQVSVMVSNDDFFNRMNRGAGVSQPDWTFQIAQIPPGSYTLVAQALVDKKQYRGVERIELGPQGAHDLVIPLEAGVDLAGTVAVEGPDAASHSASFVSLVPGDGIPWNGPQLRANVLKDGSFQFSGVPAGVWDINAGPVPNGGYLKSMYLGNQDVLTQDMTIRPGTTAPLKIVIGTRAATVHGDVTGAGQPARGVVLLAPESKFRHVLSFYRYAPVDDKGHFEINGASPGNYSLFALEEFDPQSLGDPDLLKPFEAAAVAVALKEGENQAPNLSMSSSPVAPQQANHTPGDRQ